MWCPLNNFWKTALIQFKFGMLIYNIITQVEFDLSYNPQIMPLPFKEWWRGIKCYPCPCMRPCVRASVIKIWCTLDNFWKTAWIWFILGMLIYNIKTQVEFDLGYNQ